MIPHDLHLHTQYSDGRNTVGDMIHAAVAVGLPWIGFADHYDPARDRLAEQKAEIGRSPYLRCIHVLRGSEVKIRLDGTPAMADEVLSSLSNRDKYWATVKRKYLKIIYFWKDEGTKWTPL
jgi:DNA polymerase (family 10)